MSYRALDVTVSSTGEPLSILDAKDHVRVSSSAEDVLISSLVKAARQHVENVTRRSLMTQTWRVTLDDFPVGDVIELPRSPMVAGASNVSLTYRVRGSTSDTTLASTKYLVDDRSEPGRVVLRSSETWPTDSLDSANSVTVTFKAGYGASSDVPEGIKHALKLLVGHWYQNREGVVVGSINTPLNAAVDALLAGYRVPSIP